MAHIHTENGEHDQTASAFIVRYDLSPEPRILFHMHKKLGVLLQPGGHVELKENPWQAVQHEILEETGYDPSQLTLLQPAQRLKTFERAIVHPQPVVHNTHPFDETGAHKHTDISYAFIATGEPMHRPDDGESKDLRWMTIEDVEAIPSDQIFPNVRQIAQYVLLEIITSWEEVPLSDYRNE